MSEWRPIETAPRDGTPVLLWASDFKGATARTAQFRLHPCGSGLWLLAESATQELYLIAGQATHWAPLPPGPSQSDSGKDAPS